MPTLIHKCAKRFWKVFSENDPARFIFLNYSIEKVHNSYRYVTDEPKVGFY